MTPKFLVTCKLAVTSWVGSVELGEHEFVAATGDTKADVLEALRLIVVHTTGLPLSGFELLERSDHWPSIKPKPSRLSRSPSTLSDKRRNSFGPRTAPFGTKYRSKGDHGAWLDAVPSFLRKYLVQR